MRSVATWRNPVDRFVALVRRAHGQHNGRKRVVSIP